MCGTYIHWCLVCLNLFCFRQLVLFYLLVVNLNSKNKVQLLGLSFQNVSSLNYWKIENGIILLWLNIACVWKRLFHISCYKHVKFRYDVEHILSRISSCVPLSSESSEKEENSYMVVCSTSLMASLIRSVGSLSKYFYRVYMLVPMGHYHHHKPQRIFYIYDKIINCGLFFTICF